MTELQLGLIGLGVAAVAGVLGYNKWQEMRHRKVAESLLKPQAEDPLMGAVARHAPEPVTETPVPSAPRLEPEFHVDPVSTTHSERLEPVLSMAPIEPLEAPEPETAAEAPQPLAVPTETQDDVPELTDHLAPAEELVLDPPLAMLDPRLEYIVSMDLVEPVPASQILHAQRDALTRLHKPVHWLAFNERSRDWVRLPAETDLPVRRVRIGLQLVNRLGPVPEADVAIFSNAMAALADELMAVADLPNTRVLDQAAEIDRFCADVDLEIGINLVSRGSAFSGTKIRALAEAAGMELGADGLFTRFDEDGRALFSLQNYETARFTAENIRAINTHGLTFLLDVPRVDHGERVFSQMVELAKRFAETLQGALVDDNRQPLSDSQLEHIRREFIGKPQATMARYGLAAGSAQALRLFS